jgi:hypothetical protein
LKRKEKNMAANIPRLQAALERYEEHMAEAEEQLIQLRNGQVDEQAVALAKAMLRMFGELIQRTERAIGYFERQEQEVKARLE